MSCRIFSSSQAEGKTGKKINQFYQNHGKNKVKTLNVNTYKQNIIKTRTNTL